MMRLLLADLASRCLKTTAAAAHGRRVLVSIRAFLWSHPRSDRAAGAGLCYSGRTDYLLGASTVRIAAPASRVPVVSPCVRAQQQHWSAHEIDGTSAAAPIVGLAVARLLDVAPRNILRTPEAAIWRVQVTVDAFGDEKAAHLAVGQINVGRALRGADEKTVGEDGRDYLFSPPASSTESAVAHSVVLPYPWTDAQMNISRTKSGAAISEMQYIL